MDLLRRLRSVLGVTLWRLMDLQLLNRANAFSLFANGAITGSASLKPGSKLSLWTMSVSAFLSALASRRPINWPAHRMGRQK